MKTIAIIPARGGSKRIPRKNIKDFLGKPIISYSIEAALTSNLFNEVMVSTDDIEIGNIAKIFGAKVPFFRSTKNSDDYATTSEVIVEVLNEYKKQNMAFDYICCIYPTAPFINSSIIVNSFQTLIKNNADTIIPVVRYSYPIQRAFKVNNNGELAYILPENAKKRSQDFEASYHDAGQFYWMNESAFVKKNKIVTKNTYPFFLSDYQVQDIDNLEDWIIAENKYLLNKKLKTTGVINE